MGVTIVPFTAEHLEPAAALLAARHQRDRVQAPSLPPEYEDPAAALPIVRDLLAADGTDGVVAIRGGQVVGYLLGAPEFRSPTGAFAGVMHPRAAEAAYVGHAAHLDDQGGLYQRLYAALAARWVVGGLFGHYVTVPADPDATEVWVDLGFGRLLALGLRPRTAPTEAGERGRGSRPCYPASRPMSCQMATASQKTKSQSDDQL